MRRNSERRLRAVVDTNVFVSGAISLLSHPRTLIVAWFDQRFDVVLSDAQLMEINNVFTRERIRRRLLHAKPDFRALIELLEHTPRVVPTSSPLPVRNPKDEMILAAALGGGADYVVSGDADLLVLDGDPRLGRPRIVSAGEFLALLATPSEAEPPA